MHSERLDALVTFAGCDKSLPGMLMAAARLNLPSVFLYGGSILPGHYKDQALDVVSVFEAVGACAAGTHHRERARRDRAARVPDRRLVRGHVHRQHDGGGQRGDRHGVARFGVGARRSTAAATTSRTNRVAPSCTCSSSTCGPRQIMTKEAFENAIAVVMALGGSTNAVLHLLAIAQRGARRARARRLQPRSARAVAAHRRHEAARQVPHGRPRPRRRRAGRA